MRLPAWDDHAATLGIRGTRSTRNPLNQGDVSLHDTASGFLFSQLVGRENAFSCSELPSGLSPFWRSPPVLAAPSRFGRARLRAMWRGGLGFFCNKFQPAFNMRYFEMI